MIPTGACASGGPRGFRSNSLPATRGCAEPPPLTHGSRPSATWHAPQTYDWDYFLVAACFQLVGLIMWIVGAQLLKRLFGIEGPGISGLLRRLPGFDIITGGCRAWGMGAGVGQGMRPRSRAQAGGTEGVQSR